ncbi:unnamed protein product [Candidula unifasciata]|uniref:Uncharacterized protein n=1 Tax=Candidula unifasciata TaxID=100452 RepID=A0A8S4ADP6_9EUPU|nr:unnamed protein product [Candidula unifasciata]
MNVTQKQKRSKAESQVITSFNGNLYRKKFPAVRRQHSLSRGFEIKSSHSSIFCFSDCLLRKQQMTPGMLSSVRLLETNMPFRDAMPSSSTSSKLNENFKPSFLASIKPENYRAEKTRFMQSNYNYNPCFVYSYPVSNKKMKRFRAPSNKYMPVAVLILKRVIAQFGSYENYEEISGGRSLTKDQILSVVQRYLIADKLTEQIHVNLCDDLISHGSLTRVKGETILNVRCANMRQNWAEGLLRHEIGTHYIRSRNNSCQPWGKSSVRKELNMGPVNPTEEGLASLHSVLFRTEPYLWRAALLYYTTYMASKMSFKELFHDLGKFVRSPNVRWEYCLRAKRGEEWTCRPGCFSKDQVYLEGALQLLKRRKVLDFQQLIRLGKVSFEDLDRPSITNIAKLTDTRIPCFMENMRVYLQSLDHIANTNGLTDCVLDSVD